MFNPIHQGEHGKWYFWDEVQCNEYGPFNTAPEATQALIEYSKELLKFAKKYKVNITYFNTKFNGRAYKTGLSLEAAQEICRNKESSWETCTKSHLKRRTRIKGRWFYTYTEE